MRGLHARHDAQTRESRDVGRRQDLGVLDAEPRPRAASGQHLLEDVERQRVGAVADGVHPHLEAAAGGLARDALHLLRRHQHETRVAGSSQYGAWSAAPREPSAPSSQSLTAPTVRRPSPTDSGVPRSRYSPHASSAAQGGEDAEREAPAADEPRVGGCRGQVEPGLVRAGEALREAVGDDGFHGGVEPVLARPRDQRADQVLRQIDEEARGLAALVLFDAPAFGIGVWRVMPARASAALLAHVAWPSTRTSATGWPGAARSSEARDGKRCPGQRV